MNHGPYIYNAAGVAVNGIKATDYPIQRDYHFAKDDHDPNVDYTKFIYNEFGFNSLGLDCYGRDEFGEDYYAAFGRNASEFDDDGYDKEGFDLNDLNREGKTRKECAAEAKRAKKQLRYEEKVMSKRSKEDKERAIAEKVWREEQEAVERIIEDARRRKTETPVIRIISCAFPERTDFSPL